MSQRPDGDPLAATTEQTPSREGLIEYLEQYERIPLWNLISEDAARYRGWKQAIFHWGFLLGCSYRVSHWLYRSGWGRLGKFVQWGAHFVFKCDISRKCSIGPGLAMFHPMEILVAPHVRIGRSAILNAGVFIASAGGDSAPGSSPIMGDKVFVGPGAKVLGPITIGHKVAIGPNTVVTKDIASESSVLPPNCPVILRKMWKKGATAPSSASGAKKPEDKGSVA